MSAFGHAGDDQITQDTRVRIRQLCDHLSNNVVLGVFFCPFSGVGCLHGNIIYIYIYMVLCIHHVF